MCNRFTRIVGSLLAITLGTPIYGLEDTSSSQVQIRPRIAETSRSPLSDLGISFYIGTTIYRQGNDNLRFVNATLPNGNSTTANVDTNYRPGLTLGFAIPLVDLNELQANVTIWKHTDSSRRNINNILYSGSAKLDYDSVDLLYGNTNLFKKTNCRVGLYGGLIYADVNRVATNMESSVLGTIKTVLDNKFSAIGPIVQGLVSITPIQSKPSFIVEGDLRAGLLYNNRDASSTRITQDANGNIINTQSTSIGKANGGSAYVRAQVGAYYERNVNGNAVRVGGGWQGRQYTNSFLEIRPTINPNLDIQGPFVIVSVRPHIVY